MSDLLSAVPDRYAAPRVEADSYTRLQPELRPREFNPRIIALASLDNLVLLIRSAAGMSKNALSWRNYRVGAAAVIYNFKDLALGMMTGANVKPHEQSSLSLHAEQITLAKARLMRLDHVMAITVFGDPTDLDANPTGAPTLRPCRRCNGMFQETSEVKSETLILSANSDFSHASCTLHPS